MIDGLVMIALGLWATLVGFGKVALSKNPEANAEKLTSYGKLFRIGGILIIVCGIVLILARLNGQ